MDPNRAENFMLKNCHRLLFAEDLTALLKNLQQTLPVLRIIHQTTSEFGLYFSFEKTLTQIFGELQDINLDEETLLTVDDI